MMKFQRFTCANSFTRALPYTPTFTSAWRYAFAAIAIVLLSGCFGQETVKESLDNYQGRLSRVLDTPLPETVVKPLPKLTDGSQLKYNIEGLSINLREFYAIQDCELGRGVAERNTSLGKSQLPSQRLVYESKLLSVFSACENSLRETDTKLADTLAAWKEAKEADYTQSWANLIQTSKELRLGLNSPERLLATENNRDALASINSLYFMDELLAPAALSKSIDSSEDRPRQHQTRSQDPSSTEVQVSSSASDLEQQVDENSEDSTPRSRKPVFERQISENADEKESGSVLDTVGQNFEDFSQFYQNHAFDIVEVSV